MSVWESVSKQCWNEKFKPVFPKLVKVDSASLIIPKSLRLDRCEMMHGDFNDQKTLKRMEKSSQHKRKKKLIQGWETIYFM